MKGNNRIVVNQATMVEAMQEYLDKRAAGGKADKVESVDYIMEGSSGVYKFHLSGDTK